MSFERILAQASVGPHVEAWDKAADLLETAEMPPADAEKFPTKAERTAAVAWVRRVLKSPAPFGVVLVQAVLTFFRRI